MLGKEHWVDGGNKLMKDKINWKKLGIEEYGARYGYDYEVAKILYNRIYKKAWYQTKHKGEASNINIAYETYVSTFGSENAVKLFNVDTESQSVNIDIDFSSSNDIQNAFIQKRFEGFKRDYGKSSIEYDGEQKSVNEMFEQYKNNEINYNELIDYIEQFRNSSEYNKASYDSSRK